MTSPTNSTNAIVYGKEGCTWCIAAKNLLIEKGYTVDYRRIDLSDKHRDDMLVAFPGSRTVPQVIINSVPVGGFTALNVYLVEAQRANAST